MALAMPTVSSATQFLEDRGYEVIPASFATDITAIKAKTDNLPWYPANELTSLNIAGNQTIIISKTNLIPASGIAEQATLLSVFGNTTLIKAKTDNLPASPASEVTLETVRYSVSEIERHLHGGARWFGSTAAVAPGLLTSLTPFRVTSNATALEWGAAVLIFNGTEDFDTSYTSLYFDPHQMFLANVEATGTYKMRFANSQWDGSAHTYANMADAVAANKYTEVLFKADSTKEDAVPLVFMSGRARVGSYLWAQVVKVAAGANYVDFYLGAHTYQE